MDRWFETRNRPILVLFLAVVFTAGCVPIRQRLAQGERYPAAHQEKAETKNALEIEPQDSSVPPSFEKEQGQGEWEGVASWYGDDFNGHLTASGEVYDMYQDTAAHKTLPLGTIVKVTNLENGKSTKVRINDRGPYVPGRIIDMSRHAGKAIGIRETGTAKVKLEVIQAAENEKDSPE